MTNDAPTTTAAHVPAPRTSPEPQHAATLAHCGLLRRKIDSLSAALADAMVQLYTSADREYQAGRLTMDDLAILYEQARELGPGFAATWSKTMSISAEEIRAYAHYKGRTVPANLYWSGPYPYDKSPRPTDGVPVVYVLYDTANDPIYLGSTEHFGDRMGAHRRSGKRVAWWLAFPCGSRQAAYLLEGGLLAARKPPLNIKVGR